MKTKFLNYYMNIAKETAKLSTATRLQVGAIAVKNDRIISIGYNGTPPGWNNKCEDDNNQTLHYVIHAEQNLIAKLCKANESSEGSIVFITHSPCIHCSKILFTAGVSEVYYETEYRITDGIDFLKQCGIKIEQLNVS